MPIVNLSSLASLLLASVFSLSATVASAQTSADPAAPEGTTAACKDGTFSKAGARWRACRGHKGVKAWYGKQKKTSSKSAAAVSAAPAVETQSPKVSDTGAAPKPGGPSLTPGKPASTAR